MTISPWVISLFAVIGFLSVWCVCSVILACVLGFKLNQLDKFVD